MLLTCCIWFDWMNQHLEVDCRILREQYTWASVLLAHAGKKNGTGYKPKLCASWCTLCNHDKRCGFERKFARKGIDWMMWGKWNKPRVRQSKQTWRRGELMRCNYSKTDLKLRDPLIFHDEWVDAVCACRCKNPVVCFYKISHRAEAFVCVDDAGFEFEGSVSAIGENVDEQGLDDCFWLISGTRRT